MTRKAISVLIAAVLAFSLLPAAAAFAAVPGTANLTTGGEVFPGAARDFAIRVTNNSPRTLGLVGGTAANSIRIMLPSNIGIRNTATPPTAPAGWEVTVTRTSTAQALTYNATGSGLAAGSSLDLPFAAEVLAPASADRSGKFQVSLSSDRGATGQPATGNLDTVIRVLELVQGLSVTSPAGVVDGSGTGGQAITMAMGVRNHAANALTVTPNVTSDGGETISQPAAASVASGATHTFSIPVTLPQVSADRTSNLTGTATADGAQSQESKYALQVQAPPALSLDAGSFSPRSVNTGPQAKTFTLNASKAGTPALTLAGGDLNFAGNGLALETPVDFAGGSGNNDLTYGPSTITGTDGVYDGLFTFTGTDGNGAAFTQTVTLDDLITIDSLVPNITVNVVLPLDRDQERQTAAKTGDTITVNGTVDDTNATIDFVELRPNVGDAIKVPVTRSGNNYSGSATAPFAQNATSFVAVAQATDAAQNSGGATSVAQIVDNIAPAFTAARTQSLERILVTFTENNTTKGGCLETRWQVENNIVLDVLNANGGTETACSAAANNSRILVLARPIGARDATPRVTYNAPNNLPGQSNAKDGADNRAGEAIVKAVVGIAPPVPEIIEVFRNTGGTAEDRENATFDDDRYFTRFSGNDLVVEFGNAAAGESIEVLDANNNILHREAIIFPEEGNPEVRVPIGTTQGDYVRKLRLVNVSNIRGDVAEFTVNLDQTLPAIAGATKTGASSVDVSFSEKISEGTDFAFDWLPYENVADAEGGRQYYNVDKVEGSGSTRTLTVSTFENNGEFGGAEYLLVSANGVRYGDRAGNLLADTIANL